MPLKMFLVEDLNLFCFEIEYWYFIFTKSLFWFFNFYYLIKKFQEYLLIVIGLEHITFEVLGSSKVNLEHFILLELSIKYRLLQ